MPFITAIFITLLATLAFSQAVTTTTSTSSQALNSYANGPGSPDGSSGGSQLTPDDSVIVIQTATDVVTPGTQTTQPPTQPPVTTTPTPPPTVPTTPATTTPSVTTTTSTVATTMTRTSPPPTPQDPINGGPTWTGGTYQPGWGGGNQYPIGQPPIYNTPNFNRPYGDIYGGMPWWLILSLFGEA
ncbi:hypothetical protein BaRGS_00019192 [Batillaria attramentaria]|uniref:Uncharacterized protein n=1 Tax=Batillaria attramentaria TaxID=370345 RepID=A0ABD0KRT2_9CAEN